MGVYHGLAGIRYGCLLNNPTIQRSVCAILKISYAIPPNWPTANAEISMANAIENLKTKLEALGLATRPPLIPTVDPAGPNTIFQNTSALLHNSP